MKIDVLWKVVCLHFILEQYRFIEYDSVILCMIFLGCRESTWKGPRPWAWQGSCSSPLNVVSYLCWLY
jgi:hypothetical protein